MDRLILFFVVGLCGFPGFAWAQVGFPLGSSPTMLCRQAVAMAERSAALPPHLLSAIARVESGRRDPTTGGVQPWPWTVNAEGEGFFYNTKSQAITAVRNMQAHGIRSIDVGCMQVNLMHHPDAFSSLEAAFDPAANATWAAHFLADLFAQAGSWVKAVGLYHSATPELAADYQRHVQAALAETSNEAGDGALSGPAGAWSVTSTSGGQAGGGLIHVQALLPPRHVNALRISLRPAGAAPGRDLSSYRAAPVGVIMHAWRQPAGG